MASQTHPVIPGKVSLHPNQAVLLEVANVPSRRMVLAFREPCISLEQVLESATVKDDFCSCSPASYFSQQEECAVIYRKPCFSLCCCLSKGLSESIQKEGKDILSRLPPRHSCLKAACAAVATNVDCFQRVVCSVLSTSVMHINLAPVSCLKSQE